MMFWYYQELGIILCSRGRNLCSYLSKTFGYCPHFYLSEPKPFYRRKYTFYWDVRICVPVIRRLTLSDLGTPAPHTWISLSTTKLGPVNCLPQSVSWGLVNNGPHEWCGSNPRQDIVCESETKKDFFKKYQSKYFLMIQG